MKINRIINEEIDKVLNENVSDIMYHFTYVSKLHNILKTNEILLSPSFINSSDNKSKKMYFLSLSTSRSLSVGFGNSIGTNEIARLTINGNALNYNYKSQAVDYWGHSRDPQKSSMEHVSRYDELEERIITDKDRIKPANKYINVIEILNAKPEHASIIKSLCDKLNIEFYAYDDEKYFNASVKNKAINVESVDGNIDVNNRDTRINLFDLSEIVAYLTFKDDELKNKIFNNLSKSNLDLEPIKSKVDEIQKSKLRINLNYNDDYKVTDLTNSINATLHSNMNSNVNVMRYVIREFGIDMKKNNVRTLKDYLIYKIWKDRKTQKQFNNELIKKTSNIIDKKYNEKLTELKDYRYYGEIDGDYYNNIYEYKPIINLLNSKFQQLKEFYNNYFANNNDMYKYHYVIGTNEANKYLNIDDDNSDPKFDEVLYNVDTQINATDLINIIKFINYDVYDFISDEIKSAQEEYRNQFILR